MNEAPERRHLIVTVAGYVLWVTSGLPLLLELLLPNRDRDLDALMNPSVALAWGISYAGFGVLYTVAVRSGENLGWQRAFPLLLLEAMAALAVSRLAPAAFSGALLVVVAAQVANMVSLRWAVVWVAVQSLAFAILMYVPWGARSPLAAIAHFSFGLFAIMVEHSRQAERSAKENLARANAELHATQALLVDGSRGAERLRIARELHDLLGHHLTALSLNLEVASHLVNGEARSHVEKSQQLTRLLLCDVRAAVSELREEGCFDLARALRTLTLDLPTPRVHLDLPAELCIDDPALAQIILRGAQEILTNAARHSGAENLWLGLLKNGTGIALTARDDGRGSPAVKPGNGLNGIRERVEAAGGALKIDGTSGGFKLEVWLPLEGVPA